MIRAISSIPRRLRVVVFAAALAVALIPLSGLRSSLSLADAGLRAEAPASVRTPLMRLISQDQYTNTIKRIFGTDIAVKVRLAPVKRTEGLLRVGASTAVLTSGGLDPLEGSARAIAQQVVEPGRRDILFVCKPENAQVPDARCARNFFSRVGRLLYRRSLSDRELDAYAEIAGQATETTGDFYSGVAFSLAGMLVSPNFLFIRETFEPDPDHPGNWRLDGYSRASRLSFLLWNTAPDERLLSAAERGDLYTDRGLRSEVDRMLASPLYQDGVRAFFSDFLVAEAFDTLTKDSTIYPGMTIKAVGEAREQMLRTIVDHLVTRNGDYRDLFTTRRTFMSADLAQLYRVPVNLGSQGWSPYEFSQDSPRAGILTQVGFLAQYAHPGRSSVTKRGRAVRETLLCQPVPDPPPNVDFSRFEDPKGGLKTARERLTVHQENPVCAGCHAITDPIALPLENFDGAGQYRSTENGVMIDASGSLDGVEFADAVGLGVALSENQEVRRCIVGRVFAYSRGKELSLEDDRLIEGYMGVLDRQGYRFDQILRLIVLDPSFFSLKSDPLDKSKMTNSPTTGGSLAHKGR